MYGSDIHLRSIQLYNQSSALESLGPKLIGLGLLTYMTLFSLTNVELGLRVGVGGIPKLLQKYPQKA